MSAASQVAGGFDPPVAGGRAISSIGRAVDSYPRLQVQVLHGPPAADGAAGPVVVQNSARRRGDVPTIHGEHRAVVASRARAARTPGHILRRHPRFRRFDRSKRHCRGHCARARSHDLLRQETGTIRSALIASTSRRKALESVLLHERDEGRLRHRVGPKARPIERGLRR